MASTSTSAGHEHREHCDGCDQETLHEVSLEIRAESTDPEKAVFSREPYRVTTCTRCEFGQAVRVNDVRAED